MFTIFNLIKEIKMLEIYNWSITGNANPYTPPEAIRISLCGFCPDHPFSSDHLKRNHLKHRVVTSYIVKAEGRIITTYSGSVYKLGFIDPGYRKYLKKTRPNWNWRKPITIL